MMRFETEQPATIYLHDEPAVLGVEVEPGDPAARAWDEFIGNDRYNAVDKIADVWIDPEVTNPVVRQRAVTVLTAPAKNEIELPFAGPYPAHRYNRALGFVEGNPYLANEYAAGVMFWIDLLGRERGPEAKIDAQIEYSGKVLHLMVNSDEETQEKLFSYYPVGNPDQYRYKNLRYKNLKHLIAKQDLPDKYKMAALEQFKEIVEAEAATAEMVDGIDYQDTAIVQMADLLENFRFTDSMPPELQEEILGCIEENWPSKRSYIDDSSMRRLYEILEDDDLRFRLAYRNIAPPAEDEYDTAFEIVSAEEIKMVEWVRAEARKRGFTSFDARAEAIYQNFEDYQKKYQDQLDHDQELRNQLRRLG